MHSSLKHDKSIAKVHFSNAPFTNTQTVSREMILISQFKIRTIHRFNMTKVRQKCKCLKNKRLLNFQGQMSAKAAALICINITILCYLCHVSMNMNQHRQYSLLYIHVVWQVNIIHGCKAKHGLISGQHQSKHKLFTFLVCSEI